MKLEKELELYDVWESPNGNIFIKMGAGWSIGIGHINGHQPNQLDLSKTQYVKESDTVPVKKVGKLVIGAPDILNLRDNLDWRKDFLSCDRKTAISAEGDVFNIGDLVEHDGGDGQSNILEFLVDEAGCDVFAQTTLGLARISFLYKV
jgi:hypothetical protein